MARVGLLLLFTTARATTTLCRTPAECGLAAGLCGDAATASPLQRGDAATICIGFNGNTSAAGGKKALFQVSVDHYSKLSVDTLRQTMGGAWPAKEPYSHVWVGLNGRRTIGQQAGVRQDDLCHALADEVDAFGNPVVAANSGPRCYGWAVHDKPVILPSNKIATGLTAVVHLEMGVVNRVQWDSGCNLCPGGGAGADLSCLADGTNISCVGGQCSDCYAQLSYLCSNEDDVCAPSVYVAWLGTDKHGQPLLSAGSVLSRFAAHSIQNLAGQAIAEVEKLVEGVSS